MLITTKQQIENFCLKNAANSPNTFWKLKTCSWWSGDYLEIQHLHSQKKDIRILVFDLPFPFAITPLTLPSNQSVSVIASRQWMTLKSIFTILASLLGFKIGFLIPVRVRLSQLWSLRHYLSSFIFPCKASPFPDFPILLMVPTASLKTCPTGLVSLSLAFA